MQANATRPTDRTDRPTDRTCDGLLDSDQLHDPVDVCVPDHPQRSLPFGTAKPCASSAASPASSRGLLGCGWRKLSNATFPHEAEAEENKEQQKAECVGYVPRVPEVPGAPHRTTAA
jgi:hypothetical protein